MDCFYAAIEIRDNPGLSGQPVAVGGAPGRRGVLCTCNYIARKFGLKSAMPTARAFNLCPELVLLPVNMDKYKLVANSIRQIFYNYTDLVEPLALDEAYLDVTGLTLHKGSATLIAESIRQEIWSKEKLTASAGIAPNKFLAKIASGWRKPNGIFTISPAQVDDFLEQLPISNLFGIGKVTATKLNKAGLKVCSDLRQLSLHELISAYGKLGQQLYNQCRGVDNRPVEAHKERKSLSVEVTFADNISSLEECLRFTENLYNKLTQRINNLDGNRAIKGQYVKVKFHDFILSTSSTTCHQLNLETYKILIKSCYSKSPKPVRLLGLGVLFQNDQAFGIQGRLLLDDNTLC